MKNRKFILAIFIFFGIAISAYSVDLNGSAKYDKLFKDRFVYFDQSLASDKNFELAKKVILDAKRLGFNGIVIEQEWLYSRLSHKSKILDKVVSYMSELEKLAHKNGLELIAMHYRADTANTVVHDNDSNNPFYKKDFDFSEADKEVSLFKVDGDVALPVRNIQTVKKNLISNTYDFNNIKLETEYKLTMDATTKDYGSSELKVSVLDADHNGVNGKVIFGVNKYFKNIEPTKEHGKYVVYFNSLDHKNQKGKIKVWIPDADNITIHSLTLEEVGFNKDVNVYRDSNKIELKSEDGNKTYQEGVDFELGDEKIDLLSDEIKKEKFLKLTWYPVINTSLDDQLPFTDICADEKLYYDIILDQTKRINKAFNNRVDAYALAIDEWRSAGWDERCLDLYKDELNDENITKENYSGGDYIGISTKRLIERISEDQNRSDLTFYMMSDMFDPNFNGKDPYMGVKNGALRAYKYLPKDKVVMFNWFVNPYEPGMEDKTLEDHLNSVKHFADQGIRQIIAGYHSDMRNLDRNIAVYKESPKYVQDSIVGFMYLVWIDERGAGYEDMPKVVERICKDLPGKWPEDACKRVLK